MRNLISNAIRYTEQGRILIGCRRYHGKALLAVYDTGIGISEEDMPDIFREFYQLKNPERDRSKGLGLGLAIVERMAKLLAVPLYIKSSPGAGSTFGIVITAVSASTSTTIKTVTASEVIYFDDRSVLVVDDEAAIRDSLSALLQNWHCDVIAASSGDEAVSALQKTSRWPDIILADYRLCENEKGTTVIDRINSLYEQQYAGKKIPAIIITGDTAPERMKEAESSKYKILH